MRYLVCIKNLDINVTCIFIRDRVQELIHSNFERAISQKFRYHTYHIQSNYHIIGAIITLKNLIIYLD